MVPHNVDYDLDRAVAEVQALIDGKDTPILSSCITCYACNEYCTRGTRPFDLILERMEQHGSFPATAEQVAGQEDLFSTSTPAVIEERGARMLSTCVFSRASADLLEGCHFEGLPKLRGRHFFCYILFDHLGAGSITRKHMQSYVDSLAASGAEEIVLFHDDCYSALVDVAPSVGVIVPFRPIHLIEYLRDYVAAHQDEVSPLGLRVAYQRPCASRLSPQKEPALDELLGLIGVERVERRYDREDALCCSGAIATWDAGRAAEIRNRNLEDALAAGAEAMCYLCPIYQQVLASDAEARGLRTHHLVELVRMSLGGAAQARCAKHGV